MKTMTVSEIKTHFSDVLVRVKNGENIEILYGKAKKPVAMIVPIENMDSPRPIGILDGKAEFKISGNGKINFMEHKTTRERLIEFYGEDFLPKRELQEEFDWGDPVGKEIW